MAKICYKEELRFQGGSLDVIHRANAILEEYDKQGFQLTLRQLYYQFVARGFIANTQKEYARLGGIIDQGRLAGMIDWEFIVDRTRGSRANSHWEAPADVVQSAADGYRRDLWADQNFRPEVWIEKDALVGVIAGVCRKWDVAYTSCRGYTSQSEMWRASQRLLGYMKAGQEPVILHFGDHDPSGQDMSRDITERLEMFGVDIMTFDRLALNMDQVKKYKPPPNPAKTTDSRYAGYIKKFGTESWELDALDPKLLGTLIEQEVQKLMDGDLFRAAQARQEKERKLLTKVAKHWAKVKKVVRKWR